MQDKAIKAETVSKGIKAFERLQYIALFGLSLILIAGVDIVTAKVGWSLIKNPYFYISNILVDVALLLITFGTIYLYLDWFRENNALYLEARNKIQEFALSDINVPTILSRFLEYLNRKRKIAQYQYNIKVKLHKLENDKRLIAYIPIVRLFFRRKYKYTEEEMHLWNFGTEEEKAKSKYCKKRKMYEEQLNADLIERIIDNEFVNYDRVTTDTLLSEYYSKNSGLTANDFITKNESSRIVMYRVPRLLLSFGFMILISSLLLDGITFNWLALITIASKLLSIAWNTYTSYRYAKKHAVSVTLHDMLFRKSIIVEYEKWLVEEASKTAIPVVKEEIPDGLRNTTSEVSDVHEPVIQNELCVANKLQ